MRKLSFLCSILLLTPALSFAGYHQDQFPQPYQAQLIQDFEKLLALPNDLTQPENQKQNAQEIIRLFKQRGIQAQLLLPENDHIPPVVFAEWKVPGATKTLLFYAHYDGVTPNPEKWTVTQPYHPVLLSLSIENGGKPVTAEQQYNPDWRLYARSAADDKAGVMAILGAISALKATSTLPAVNLKFIIEGEEETGSDYLEQVLKANHDLVKSDDWIIIDGGVHASGRKALIFGARGDMYMDLTVYGAKHPLHSGEYSSFAPNPAMRLAKLISSMQDDKGHVLIKGFYAGVEPLGKQELAAIAETPNVDRQLKAQLGFAREETTGKTLAEDNNQPSLIIRGINSGAVGNAAVNLIPSTASASIEMRLVKGNDWQKMADNLMQHIRQQGYVVLDHDPTDTERARYPFIAKITMGTGSYNAERIPVDSPFAKWVIKAVKSASKQPVVIQPTDGGSLPLVAIRNATGAQSMSIGFVNYDNDQHAENENVRLGNFFDGIDTILAIMKR